MVLRLLSLLALQCVSNLLAQCRCVPRTYQFCLKSSLLNAGSPLPHVPDLQSPQPGITSMDQLLQPATNLEQLMIPVLVYSVSPDRLSLLHRVLVIAAHPHEPSNFVNVILFEGWCRLNGNNGSSLPGGMLATLSWSSVLIRQCFSLIVSCNELFGNS